jgi:hypothetical protein
MAPTLTEPVGVAIGEAASGIFNLVPGGVGKVPDAVLVSFFGAGSDNNTFDVRLWGWDSCGSVVKLWLSRPLASFTCTLSATVGVATANVINTDRIVDTITVNAVAPQMFYPDVGLNAADAAAAVYRGTVRIYSPATEFMAYAIVPLNGCEKLQFDFDMTGATNGNALLRFIDFN